jgi:hypothetical protein
VIYHGFTGEPPTRIVVPDTSEQAAREYGSPFYKFAAAAFEAIGLDPSPQAFREAAERWDKSRDFSKRGMERILWGELTPVRRPAKRKKLPE